MKFFPHNILQLRTITISVKNLLKQQGRMKLNIESKNNNEKHAELVQYLVEYLESFYFLFWYTAIILRK